MDFDINITYSDEQQAFRKEVRAWLDQNAPKRVFAAEDVDLTREDAVALRDWQRKLGAKGWLVPTVSKELGGGGLTPQHAVVINEELADRGLPGGGPGILMPAIMVHGTEEQKQRFVKPTFQGEYTVWQVFTEPEAGSDLASLRTRGIRDGDEWVVNGSKQFVGSNRKPDYLFTLVNTNPDAPRHENISLMMINAQLPGVTIAPMDLVGGGAKQFVFFDNVRVPTDCLIGQEGKGWAMANTTLELEHGGSGTVGGGARGTGRFGLVEKVVDYLKA
jgi:alkylation response protein AidB-like acyl-CoA dehydrogenase